MSLVFGIMDENVVQCNVNEKFKVTFHEQVRYTGSLQY